ncbi:MAG: alpha/beta hydrolase [Myxococcota bacterium]
MSSKPTNVDVGTGAVLAVCRTGPEHAPAVLFIHGLGADFTQFEREQQALADRMATVAFCLRGHGKSSGVFPDEPGAVEVLAHDTLALIDHLGLASVHVVGNSLGGLVGYELLARRSEVVRSLVTFGTTAQLHTGRVTWWLLQRFARLLGIRGMAALAARSASPDRVVARRVAAMIRGLSLDTYLRLSRAIATYDYRPTLRQSTVPYLLLRGEKDSSINAALASTLAVVDARPTAQCVELAGAGHFANLEVPEAFERALRDFWGSLDPALEPGGE